MSPEELRTRLEGCYVTIPTPFKDEAGFPVDEAVLRRYARFLIEGGLTARTATFLAGGAAGDFSTMTFDERLRVAEVVLDEVGGRIPVAMGAQTTSTLELVRLAKAAQAMGADFIQVSCPFYFNHVEADFEEFVRAAAEAAPRIGIIVYNTFWTATAVSFAMVERLAKIPNVVGLKWATPRTDAMEFEDVVSHFSDRFTVIDNNLFFAYSAMPALGARAFEVHLCNFWPEWGTKLIGEVDGRELSGNRPHAGPGSDALLQALGQDRARIHQRRRLPRQALHGAGRAAGQPLPPADPRHPPAIPRRHACHDAQDRRAAPGGQVTSAAAFKPTADRSGTAASPVTLRED